MSDVHDGPTSATPMAEYWRTRGRVWVEFQDTLDRLLAPLGEAAFARLLPRQGEAVLDIGCGCGTTTLELAAAVQPGRVTGVDLSAPMLEEARARADAARVDNVEFVETDAQSHPFQPRSFDALYSRLGTMFFDDPIAAFTNLRRALRPGGRLAFVCWRSLDENPWAHEPRQAVAAILPEEATVPADTPGPWSMAQADGILDTLTSAGFADVEITPHDEPLDVAGTDVDAGVDFYLRLLPTGYLLIEPDRHVLDRVKAALRAVLQAHLGAGGTWMGSASWIVSAR